MHSTLIELAQNVLCTVAFAIFLLPPGYLAMRLLNLKNMRQKSGDEQLLWSVALSIPLALLLGELLGRILGTAAVRGARERDHAIVRLHVHVAALQTSVGGNFGLDLTRDHRVADRRANSAAAVGGIGSGEADRTDTEQRGDAQSN